MEVIIREATKHDLDDLTTLLVDFSAVHASQVSRLGTEHKGLPSGVVLIDR